MALRTFTVYADYETPEHAGAGGMFQIIELTEHDGDGEHDVTKLVDHGIHFRDAKHVESYLQQDVFPGDECTVSVERS